ncbi:MAG: hypothetical protein WDO56_32730 [Gammaproteobacteria bacterium]
MHSKYHRLEPSRRLATVAVILVSSVLHACASASSTPFVVALPNGYYLQRDRDSRIGLIKRGGRQVIRGPIAAYAVNREIVAGCVGEWPRRSFAYPNETPFPDSPDCRYFILDTPSGRLEMDMDPQAWRARLGQIGAPESLQITAPVLPQ